MGMRFSEAFPFLPERIADEFRTVFKSGKPLITKDAHNIDDIYRYVEVTKTPIFDQDGLVEKVISVIREITEKKLAEESLRESQLLVRTLLDLPADSVVVVLDRDYRILDFNENLPKLLGVSRQALLNQCCFDFHPPEVARIRKEKIEEMLSTGRPVRFEDENGGVWFDNIIYPIPDTEGNIARIAIFAYDITTRKQAEEALRESEARFRRLAENSPDMVFRMSIPDGLYEYVSPAALRTTGYTAKEFYKTPLLIKKAIHPDWIDWFAQKWEILINEGEIDPIFEWQIIDRSGQPRWQRQTNTLIRDDTGRIIAIEGIVTDITDRKRAEEELKVHRDRLEQQVEARTEELKKAIGELEAKSLGLQELNTALKVLIRQREDDKKDLEQRFVSNIKKLVLPHVEKLRNNHLDARQHSLVDIVEANLNEVVAPFLNSIQQYNFTPREIFIASLIKDGKSTKEIAEIVGTACSSVDSHRNSIRMKLGLKKKKTNLQTYLRTLG
jgi:PAS domain S-box-containing protein